MKRILFLLVILSINQTVLSQNRFATFTPILKNPIIQAFQVNENDKGILELSYYSDSHLYWTSFDNEGQIIEKKEVPCKGTKLAPIGVLNTADKTFHFYEDYGHIIHIFSADQSGKWLELKRADVTKSKLKEKIIARIADNGIFYLLVLSKKEKLLKLWKFIEDTQEFEVKAFPIDRHWVKQFKDNTFQAITCNKLLTPSTVASLFKTYISSEKNLILTIDGYPAKDLGRTNILTLDWNDKKLEITILGNYTLPSGSYTNSLIYDHHFLYIYATKSRLDIDIATFPENVIINTFDYKLNDTIDILNSPFYSEKEVARFFKTKTKRKEISQPSTKKILNKLAQGTPFILPKKLKNNEILLTIGAYSTPQQYSGFSPGMPGSTINTPYGSVAIPGTPGSFNTYEGYERTSFFHTKIHPSNFEKIDVPELLENQINPALKFVKNELSEKHDFTIFSYQGKPAVVHYLSKEQEIKIDIFE